MRMVRFCKATYARLGPSGRFRLGDVKEGHREIELVLDHEA